MRKIHSIRRLGGQVEAFRDHVYATFLMMQFFLQRFYLWRHRDEDIVIRFCSPVTTSFYCVKRFDISIWRHKWAPKWPILFWKHLQQTKPSVNAAGSMLTAPRRRITVVQYVVKEAATVSWLKMSSTFILENHPTLHSLNPGDIVTEQFPEDFNEWPAAYLLLDIH